MAATLRNLGGIEGHNIHLLQGPTLEELRKGLGLLHVQIARARSEIASERAGSTTARRRGPHGPWPKGFDGRMYIR